MITLYDYELSGNCYKIRLLLSFLGIDYQKHAVEFYPAAEHKSDDFLSLNPMGQLPVLVDDDLTLRETHAILAYLAARYDSSSQWYPTAPASRHAQITQWLCFADALTGSASAARLAEGFFYDLDADTCRKEAHRLFRILDEHLWFNESMGQRWIVEGDHPTIADIGCFAYVMLSEEGSISRMDYGAIRRWADHLKRIPGFIVMPGIFPAGPATPTTSLPT